MERLKNTLRAWVKTLSSFYVVRGFPGEGDASWHRWLDRRADPAYAHQLSDMNLLKVKKVEGVVHFVRDYSGGAGRSLRELQILDAGCGYGAYACVLATLGCRVTGIDMNQELVRTAEKRAAGFGIRTIEFSTGDSIGFLEKTPPSSHDIILALDTLEHMENPHLFLDLANRALVPGGNFLIIVPNGNSFIELVYHPFADWIHRYVLGEDFPEGAVHIQRMTLNQLKRMLAGAGFTVCSVQNTYASGIFGLLFLLGGFRGRCADLNLRIADHLPSSFAAGWLIRAAPSHDGSTASHITETL
jgi:2-polyprenyl-3-methyl-5-hydroxy-6-metoxy-1,4-benzoquinol methylase